MRDKDRLAVWWDRFGSGTGTVAPGLVEALSRKGIECYPLSRSSPGSGPGVLIFDGDAPELVERVREHSRHGEERLIAVGTQREALARGAGWRLLEAGASDVLAATEGAETAEAIAARFERWEEVDRLVCSSVVTRNLVGRSLIWLVPELSGSEFFGHERGSFTSAVSAREGLCPGRRRHAVPG